MRAAIEYQGGRKYQGRDGRTGEGSQDLRALEVEDWRKIIQDRERWKA